MWVPAVGSALGGAVWLFVVGGGELSAQHGLAYVGIFGRGVVVRADGILSTVVYDKGGGRSGPFYRYCGPV